jgi:hypothetical protein
MLVSLHGYARSVWYPVTAEAVSFVRQGGQQVLPTSPLTERNKM